VTRPRAARVVAVAAAALAGTACSSTSSPAATVASSPRPTMDAAAPPFPVPQPVHFHPATPTQCSGARTARISADLFDAVVDVAHLAQRAKAVALVEARYQRSYWLPNGYDTGFDPIGGTPQTATDFKVLQTYKGTLPAWIQGRQQGAPPGSLPQCDGAGYEMTNDATPRLGAMYVIFLTADQGGGWWAPSGQYARLEVRGGQAYSAQYQKPTGLSWTDVNGVSLPEVARQITG
jgi:hypothetical protein